MNLRAHFLLLLSLPAALLAQDGPPSPGVKFLTPPEAIAKMTFPEGFQVIPAAAEPEIIQPFAFTFDDRGRVWLSENLNYETRTSDSFDAGPKGRILILEDTDEDGRFDKKTLFADNIFFPTGLAVGFGGVWVGSPPNLLFIPDRDGDDIPDGEPEIVLDGWGRQDRHETLNSFLWGPDGWLYGLQGVFTHSRVGKPGTPDAERVPINAGVWRYHPTKKVFEVFAWGTSNPWGLDFNAQGQLFETACVIPHLWHMIQGGHYHRQAGQHFNPHVYDDIKTITDHPHASAHGGARFYLADQFPEKYHGQLFMCNIHEHGVLTDILTPRGSGFTGSHGENFCMANDNQWLGFNMELGPDGSVYVLDWHDADICGRAVIDGETGRLWRISYGEAPNPKFDLAVKNDDELAAIAVTSANEWHSRQARRILQERHNGHPLASSTFEMLRIALENEPDLARKLRALWALHVTGSAGTDLLTGLLDHDEAYLRAWAIQLLAEGGVFPEKLAEMAKSDPSPVVRLYLSSAAQRMDAEARWPVLENLAAHGSDNGDHNLPKMHWYALEPLIIGNPERAIALARNSKIDLLSRYVARRLSAEVPRFSAKPSSEKAPASETVSDDGLVLHLDADDLADEGAVEKWGESAQVNGDARPTVRPDVGGRKAVVFDGVDDRLEAGHREDLAFGIDAAYTLAVWVRPDGDQDGWRGIVTKSRDADKWYGLWNNKGRWSAGASGSGHLDAGSVSPGWQHLCVVQQGGERRIYENGYLAGTGPAADSSGTGALWIGGAAGTEEFFRGGISDVRIYRRALSPGEISHLAEAEAPAETGTDADTAFAALVERIDTCEPRLQAAMLAGIREGLAGNPNIAVPANWATVSAQLMDSELQDVKNATRELSVLFGDEAALARLREIMKTPDRSPDERRQAMETLVQKRVEGLAADLHPLLDQPDLLSDVLRSLSAVPDDATPGEILRRYADFPPREKGEAVLTLAARPGSGLALLAAIEAGRIPRTDVTPTAARQLANLGSEEVSTKLAAVWGVIAEKKDLGELRGHFNTTLRPEALAKADPVNGRRVFQRLCASCHQMFGEGGTLAPDLTGSDRRNTVYILDNVLDPNADIGKDYQYSTFTLQDDRVLLGIIATENDTSITVKTLEGELVLAKDDLKARVQLPVSMMPEGLFQNLTDDEARDIMRYFQSNEQVVLPEP